jgi:hypothetical protein
MAAMEHAVKPPTAKLVTAIVGLCGDAADVEESLFHLLGIGASPQEQVERTVGPEALR